MRELMLQMDLDQQEQDNKLESIQKKLSLGNMERVQKLSFEDKERSKILEFEKQKLKIEKEKHVFSQKTDANEGEYPVSIQRMNGY